MRPTALKAIWTPGGHRRYREADVALFVAERAAERQGQAIQPEAVA